MAQHLVVRLCTYYYVHIIYTRDFSHPIYYVYISSVVVLLFHYYIHILGVPKPLSKIVPISIINVGASDASPHNYACNYRELPPQHRLHICGYISPFMPCWPLHSQQGHSKTDDECILYSYIYNELGVSASRREGVCSGGHRLLKSDCFNHARSARWWDLN